MTEIPQHMWDRVPEGWYGFDIPDELIPLVIEFDEKLKKIAPDYTIHQIKEKFWTLRLYVEICGSNLLEDDIDAAAALIEEYESKGTHILKEVYRRYEEARRDY